jgi:hypothetical protein
VHPILLAAIADRLAAQLSRDAVRWRAGPAGASDGRPVALDFRLAGAVPSYGPALLEALRLRVAAPYTARGGAAGVPVVGAGPERLPDAEVTVRLEERDGAAGLAYEVAFRDGRAPSGGWCPLADA